MYSKMTQSKTYSFKWSSLCPAHTNTYTNTHKLGRICGHFCFVISFFLCSIERFRLIGSLCSFPNSLYQCDSFKEKPWWCEIESTFAKASFSLSKCLWRFVFLSSLSHFLFNLIFDRIAAQCHRFAVYLSWKYEQKYTNTKHAYVRTSMCYISLISFEIEFDF